MANLVIRLDRLTHRIRPAGCWSVGSRCETFVLVGDGSDDPPEPDLPDTCSKCGRPAEHHVVLLVGVDVDRT